MIAAARLRRRLRPHTAVDVAGALNLCGVLLKYMSPAALLPAAVALGYSEPVWPFLAAGLIAAAAGWSLERSFHGREVIGIREGFLVVSLTWLLSAGFGALPYVLAQEAVLGNPLNAYFEAMSGFTTTGSSVLVDPQALSHSLLMWRQFTQWLGGMGIIVLALAVLPRLRVGGRQLLEHEMPGPEIEPLTASIRSTARRLWLLYVGLTAVLLAILSIFAWTGVDGTMSFYDAVAHAFTTTPTAGFSTKETSVEAFGRATQWVLVLFMALGGVNFALLYRAIVRHSPRALARDEEFRLYLVLILLGSGLLLAELLTDDILAGEEALRHSVFQAVSITTTTGYASADYTAWTALTAMTIVALMFAGGSAGSTAGSVKVVRHLLIGKMLRRELDQTVHPEIVRTVRLNGAAVDERTLRAVITFVLLYIGCFVVGAAGLALESARTNVGISPFEAIAAAAATLGNVGPAFGFAGPFGSFEPFSDLSKLIMIGLMWLGRLEIIPIVVLLTRNYWRG
ncbi:MAG: TrkH family potassium uptake protein [Gaiellaceae bacterium]